jgi:hypothetical protein
MVELASVNEDPATRDAALVGLAHIRDDGVRRFIVSRVNSVEDPETRKELIWGFLLAWGTENTMQFLETCALEDVDPGVRQTAIHQLTRRWRSKSTRRLLLSRPSKAGERTRIQFIRELVRQWKDDKTRGVLAEVAEQDENAEVRRAALTELVAAWPDAPTKQLLVDRSTGDPDDSVRQSVLDLLSRVFRGDQQTTPAHAEGLQGAKLDPTG